MNTRNMYSNTVLHIFNPNIELDFLNMSISKLIIGTFGQQLVDFLLVEKKPKTFEQHCLDKLKELGVATASEWAESMGYERGNALAKVIRRILSDYSEQIEITCTKKPRRYKAV